MVSGFGLDSCQTTSYRPLHIGKSNADWKKKQNDSNLTGKSTATKARLQTASARPTTKNLTISYGQSLSLKNNFDHISRPFATKKKRASDNGHHYLTS
jgi:peptide subunit release factor 1 (eRF1)|tara:strand:- start:57 stop:350 length:294 start_codon:yes stop_codon:yes gene_type:complete